MSSRRVPNPIPSARRGFSLVEMLITLTVLATVMIVLMTVMYSAQRSKAATTNQVESTQGARIAMDMMARDLRSAGYGVDLDWTALPQPPIAYVDSLTVLINADMSPWPDSLPGHPMGIPQAYRPDGLPRPFQLNGTTWQPPIKYRRGAEVVRWTLDANNDGAVNASDWTVPRTSACAGAATSIAAMVATPAIIATCWRVHSTPRTTRRPRGRLSGALGADDRFSVCTPHSLFPAP